MLQGDGRRSSTSTLKAAPASIKLLFEPPPDPGSSSKAEQYFASAVGHNLNRQANLRQRGSASGSVTPAAWKNSASEDWEEEWEASISHSRSFTESATSSRTNGHHPLQNGSFASASSTVGRFGSTRPHLSRLIDLQSAANGVDQDIHSANGNANNDPSSGEEREVLVHEVLSTDSLPGVSLKYGISLANLRKANHLWPSDPIHLRQVLYIPLDMMLSQSAMSFRARLLRPANGDDVADSDQDSRDAPPSPSSSECPISPASTIRRIPASQLSFFPPPSSSSDMKSQTSISSASGSQTQPIPVFNAHSRSATAPSASLTALLTALPIAASTRDTIIARLSFDSSRGSSVSDDQEHEMDSVRARRYRDDDPFETPKLPSKEPNRPLRSKPSFASSTKGKAPASPPPPHASAIHSRTSSLHSNRSGYDSYDTTAQVQLTSNEPLSGVRQRPATIRTAQMEPSPAMQLPSISRTSSSGLKTKQRKPIPTDDYELW